MNPDVLKDRYERLCRDTSSDIYYHMPTFVKAVNDLDAQVVVELGVRYGLSTIAWLYGLQDTGGQLWSVDCSFPWPPKGVEDLLNPQGPLGVVPYWVFILGYDTWDSVLSALPDKDIDILFIDTNHVYEETLVELELYYPRVRKGGRIYLHDTNIETTGNAVTPQPPYPVRTAVTEFCEKYDLKWENETACFGLGTIYC